MPAERHLSDQEFAAVKRVHDEYEPDPCGEYCYDIAQRVQESTGLSTQAGTYRGVLPHHPKLGAVETNHAWNVSPSGAIVDAAADFYGHKAPRIVPPDDPDYPNYTSRLED